MRVEPTRTISTRGRARRVRRTRRQVAPSSPRYTSPPDDMFLPNTPPAGENTLSTSAVPAPASPPDDMYLPNTPPAGDTILAASGSPAAVSAFVAPAAASASACQRHPSPFEDFQSDSSEELPESITPVPRLGIRNQSSVALQPSISTPPPAYATQGTLPASAAASTSTRSMLIQSEYPFLSSHAQQTRRLLSPFDNLSQTEFDAAIKKALDK